MDTGKVLKRLTSDIFPLHLQLWKNAAEYILNVFSALSSDS